MKPTLHALAWLALLAASSPAQSITYSQPVGADTFVSSGAPNANFGTQGAMEIAAPTAAQPRTLLTLLRFDTADLPASFDADFGAGNWMVTSVTLSLFSSVAIAGQQPNNGNFNRIAAGGFEFDLLGNSDWSEEGITWNTLGGILPGNHNANSLTPLGSFFWSANGQAGSTWTLHLDLNLVQKISSGERVTLLGQPLAGSGVGYLFNTRNLNPGLLNVTVQAAPEPAVLTLLAGSLCVLGGSRFFKRK
jgi:hypothetical protein